MTNLIKSIHIVFVVEGHNANNLDLSTLYK